MTTASTAAPPSVAAAAAAAAAPTAGGRSTFAAMAIIVPVVYCGMVAHELVEGRVGASNLTLGWLAALAAVSALSFVATLRLVPVIKDSCLKAGLSGRDINKGGTDPIPEALGIVPATVYLMAAISLKWFFIDSQAVYNAALTSMCLMLFLGFADDVLDVRWSIKLLLSFLAGFPLIMAYDGPTNIIVPTPLRAWLGYDITLGVFYLLYMEILAVFCTNAINIFAGINGLETGQAVVIAFEILVHNFLELNGQSPANHILSIFLMLPFLMVTLALFYYNKYPSQVFVGDTFTYFAGMAFAVAGILGHFSKTLMIIFMPQAINAVLSLPQLLKIIPCPRHRLPILNTKTGKLEYSKNFTLINAWLFLFGPATERSLANQLLCFQIFCGVVAYFIRYHVAAYFYAGV